MPPTRTFTPPISTCSCHGLAQPLSEHNAYTMSLACEVCLHWGCPLSIASKASSRHDSKKFKQLNECVQDRQGRST